MSDRNVIYLCPGQGAQAVGMGRRWLEHSKRAAATFADADAQIATLPSWSTMRPLTELCFEGPASDLDRTDVSQPALYACGIASFHALRESSDAMTIRAAAGLSLGEYTALTIAGALRFGDGIRIVVERGRLMQLAAEASRGGMLALIGADEAKALQVCADAAKGEVLVCANFNAPGQIVLSGHASACDRAEAVATQLGLRFSRLKVAGAFHSPLMAPAAEGLAKALESVDFAPFTCEVWSNVTGTRHDSRDLPLLKKRLVEQLVSPVRWSQGCEDLIASLGDAPGAVGIAFHEVAPSTVLKGLMRRINRSVEVLSHDEPPEALEQPSQSREAGQPAKPIERATS